LAGIEERIRQDIRRKGTLCFPLIDTQELSISDVTRVASIIEQTDASAILVGGSTIADQLQLDRVTRVLKRKLSIPVILFPGNITGITRHADAILFLSLLNSDNPYYIVQAQALAAATIKKWKLEALPTGYIIIGDGATTGFIGQARGIPIAKPEIAAMYALAAQYMGMRFVYLEAGSGASQHVPEETVRLTRRSFTGTLIVGGGIRSARTAKKLSKAGADILVVGTQLERDPSGKSLAAIIDSISGVR